MKISQGANQVKSPRVYQSLLAIATALLFALLAGVVYFSTRAASTDKKLTDCRNELMEHQLYSPPVACGDGHGGLNQSSCTPSGVDCKSAGTCVQIGAQALCSLYVRNTAISGYTCGCVPSEVRLCYIPDPADVALLHVGYQRCAMSSTTTSSWGACTPITGL